MFGRYDSNRCKKTPNSVYNINQARKAIKRRPICLTDSDHDYILDEIKRGYTIEYDK